MTDYALEIDHLHKSFTDFALQDVSFALPKGFIMGLVGRNGAGKTTTIKLLLALLQKNSGSLKIFGKEICEAMVVKQEIAVVFDDIFFLEQWKITDVEAAIAPFYSRWDTKIFQHHLQRFRLPTNKKIKDFSKGMKMKLMLAVALSHHARLLILDEPTSGLDPVARDELLDILLEYVEDENNSVLFSTHITSDLEKIADFLTILNDGTVFYTGPKQELFDHYCLVKGDLAALTPESRAQLIGVQETLAGFSALLPVEKLPYVTPDMVTETATIDDILIHLAIEK